MTKIDLITEKFKVLLATIFPVEEAVEIIAEETVELDVEVPEVVEIKLEEATLEDGTIVSYENLEVGSIINVVNEDGTLTPIADGEWVINDVEVSTVDGAVVEAEAEVEVITEPVVMEEEVPEVVEPTEDDIEKLIEGKVEEVKLAYESKMAAQKAEFDAQIEALGLKFKETTIIQAPVEVEKVPLTYKERLSVELAEKRKERNF